MNDWELKTLVTLNATVLLRPYPDKECLDLIKSEIRDVMQELWQNYYSEEPKQRYKKLLNKILSERNIEEM